MFINKIFVYHQNIWNEKYIFEWYIFFLACFIDGKTFVWIYIFLYICLSTKYLKWKISLWMRHFFSLFYRWENVRLDFFKFGWYLFFNLFFRGENSSISSTWVVTKSYLRGIDEGDRTIAHAWSEVTGSDVTVPFTFFFIWIY